VNDLKNRIKEILEESETSWAGFVDVPELVEKLNILMTGHSRDLLKSKQVLIHDLKEPSEAFEEAFSNHHGTTSATCELCGRTVFTADLEHSGDDEHWEECMAGLQNEPDKYVFVNYNAVLLGSINSKQVVIGCPCNGLRRYEDFIWQERRGISEYMAKRLEMAEQTLVKLREQVSDISKGATI